MIRLLICILTMAISAVAGQAEQPRITLFVAGSDGSSRPTAWAEARNARGEVDFKAPFLNGKLEILDLGIGPHSILVGCHACTSVELKNILFYTDKPQTYRILLDGYQARPGQLGRGCDALLRIRDGEDRPLRAASLAWTGTDLTYEVDEYARAWFTLGANDSMQFRLTAPDLPSCDIEIACGEWGHIERSVTMTAGGCSIEEYEDIVWGRGKEASKTKP